MPGSGWFRARIVVPVLLAACVIAGFGLKRALPTVKTPPPKDGQDWAQFLGPHGTGVSDETDVLETWPKGGPKVLWEQRVGTGYSAPSVRGDKLVLHHRIEDEEVIDCKNPLTGKTIWTHKYSTSFEDRSSYVPYVPATRH